MRRFSFLLLLVVVVAGSLVAKDFWEQSYKTWKRDQVLKMLSDSPWAESQTMTGVVGDKSSGVGGEKEMFHKFTVRFFSAQPVREAYVRMMQIMNKYDDLDEQRRLEMDARFSRPLKLDVSERVIVAMEFSSNDPGALREFLNFLGTARAETLKQSVYLITEKQGRVSLLEYFPPANDGTGAKFVFPRVVDGQPIVRPEDKEVRFDFWAPVINQRVFIAFKPAKMVYAGSLTY